MYQYRFLDAVLPVFSLLNNRKRNKRKCYNEGDFVYTALGDSITNGFGCILSDGFSYRIYRSLRHRIRNFVYENFGSPGITSYQLLQQLKKNRGIRAAVRNADIITITIGGNNLIKSTCNNFRIINKEKAAEGVIEFQRSWQRILYMIRESIGSDAAIFVMNLYNPYDKEDYNYPMANYFIAKINEKIEDGELIEKYCYRVINVYDLFKGGNFWTGFDNIIKNPHPNYEGHKQIAKLFEQKILTSLNDDKL